MDLILNYFHMSQNQQSSANGDQGPWNQKHANRLDYFWHAADKPKNGNTNSWRNKANKTRMKKGKFNLTA